MRAFRGGRPLCVVSVTIALLVGAVTACGGDADDESASGGAAASIQAPPPLPPEPPPRRPVAAKWSSERLSRTPVYANADGVLVRPNGTEVRGWGDRPTRRYVTALFARMQYDFLTGRMASVCRHVDPRLLSGFPPDGAFDDAPCDEKLKTYAQQREKEGLRSSPLRFLWVRTYPGVAGIWVEDVRGRRFRIPFVQHGSGGWRLELGELTRPDALGMPLQVKGS